MADGELTVEGPDITAGFHKLAANVAALAETENKAAKLIAEAVRPLIPKQSGRLASGLTVAGGEVRIGGVRYAGPIEFGVGPRPGMRGPHNIRPAHYMERGTEAASPGVETLFANDLETQVSKVRNG